MTHEENVSAAVDAGDESTPANQNLDPGGTGEELTGDEATWSTVANVRGEQDDSQRPDES